MIPRFLLIGLALLLGGCATSPYSNFVPNRFLFSDAGFPPIGRPYRYASNPWIGRSTPPPHLHSSRYRTSRYDQRRAWRSTRGRATISPNRNVFTGSPRYIAPPPRVIRVR